MNATPTDEELLDWQSGAEELLRATADAAGLVADDILIRPRGLVPALDGLLAEVDLSGLDEEEFLNLNAQLMALVAQVLIVEQRAFWTRLPGPAHQIGLAVPEDGRTHVFNVASVVKAVLTSAEPSASETIRLAESLLET